MLIWKEIEIDAKLMSSYCQWFWTRLSLSDIASWEFFHESQNWFTTFHIACFLFTNLKERSTHSSLKDLNAKIKRLKDDHWQLASKPRGSESSHYMLAGHSVCDIWIKDQFWLVVNLSKRYTTFKVELPTYNMNPNWFVTNA